MRELNLGFDGKVKHKIEDGAVPELQFFCGQVGYVASRFGYAEISLDLLS